MAELPVLPITTAALVADTTHMSAEEFGAYVRILLAMWGNGAELIDDDHILARIAGVALKRWQIIRKVVLGPVSVTDGMLHQKRLSKTWDSVQKVRVKRVTASKERWHRERLRDAHAYASGYAKPMQNASTNDAHAMHMECNSKLKDKITTTFVGTAREGLPTEPVEKPEKPLPQDFQERAKEAVQKSTGIGSGELTAVLQAKGWVKPC